MKSNASLVQRAAGYLWREWIRPLALPLLGVAAAKAALADINLVPTGSMRPTILEGDVVFVNKLAYDLRVPLIGTRLARWSDPARGEIVVCFSPDDGTRLVKRIVGAPGDTVELRNNILFLNGTALSYDSLPTAPAKPAPPVDEHDRAHFAREELPGHSHAVMTLPNRPALRTFPAVVVPEGHYLVLGDNRDNSRDSRFFGFVPRAEIVGRAEGVFVSANPDRYLQPRFHRFFSRLE